MEPEMTDERPIEVAGLAIHSERTDDLAVVSASGELGIANRDALDQELRRLEEAGVAEIVLDLRDLDFIDSTGVRILYEAYIRNRASGDRLRMIRGRESVQRVITRLGLGQVLPFVD
jgi:anti-anti-sigma factor